MEKKAIAPVAALIGAGRALYTGLRAGRALRAASGAGKWTRSAYKSGLRSDLSSAKTLATRGPVALAKNLWKQPGVKNKGLRVANRTAVLGLPAYDLAHGRPMQALSYAVAPTATFTVEAARGAKALVRNKRAKSSGKYFGQQY